MLKNLITSQGGTCPLLNLLACLPNLLLLCMFIRQADKTHKNAVYISGVVEDQLSMGRQWAGCSNTCDVQWSQPWHKQRGVAQPPFATGTRGCIQNSFRQARANPWRHLFWYQETWWCWQGTSAGQRFSPFQTSQQKCSSTRRRVLTLQYCSAAVLQGTAAGFQAMCFCLKLVIALVVGRWSYL